MGLCSILRVIRWGIPSPDTAPDADRHRRLLGASGLKTWAQVCNLGTGGDPLTTARGSNALLGRLQACHHVNSNALLGRLQACHHVNRDALLGRLQACHHVNSDRRAEQDCTAPDAD